jgi:hypothetical protein
VELASYAYYMVNQSLYHAANAADVLSPDCPHVMVSTCTAVFSLTGAFSLTGMTAASGDNLDITFTLAKEAQCPINTDTALLPVIKVLRR